MGVAAAGADTSGWPMVKRCFTPARIAGNLTFVAGVAALVAGVVLAGRVSSAAFQSLALGGAGVAVTGVFVTMGSFVDWK